MKKSLGTGDGSPGSGVWCLEAGEALPAWVERLDRTAFGSAWKAPSDQEGLWLLPERGFARWTCIPAAGEAE